MRQLIAMIVLCVLQASLAPAQTPSPTTPPTSALERNFAPGGKITLRLPAGDYTIRSGSNDKIHLQWETKKPEQLQAVKVEATVQGAEASIRIRAPKRSDFRAIIELPARTDLDVRLNAGDLNIRGVEGKKDVECHAGDITIDVGSATDYSRVDASARAGDIEAPPFGASKGGLFRSFRWEGKGKHVLHVHVGAGSITLLGTK